MNILIKLVPLMAVILLTGCPKSNPKPGLSDAKAKQCLAHNKKKFEAAVKTREHNLFVYMANNKFSLGEKQRSQGFLASKKTAFLGKTLVTCLDDDFETREKVIKLSFDIYKMQLKVLEDEVFKNGEARKK
jgi:hypothetical protein